MDITRAFEASGVLVGITINFQGTLEDPMFQANQIGALLGIVNIRETIKDFDEDERRVSSTDTSIGARQALFLTEAGLYRLLFMSRKPLARPFQKWVASIVKELRVNGKYEMEKRLLTAEHGHALALENQKAGSAATSAAAVKQERHDTLMRAYANRPLLYLGEVGALPDGRLIVKYGETDDIEERVKGLRNTCGEFILTDVFPCSEPHMLEQWLKKQRAFITRRYSGAVNSRQGREYLAVALSDYAFLKRFIKSNMTAHSGWTIKQQLEKARYDAVRHMSLAARDMRAMLESPSSVSSLGRTDICNEVVGLLGDLRTLISTPGTANHLGEEDTANEGPQSGMEDDREGQEDVDEDNVDFQEDIECVDHLEEDAMDVEATNLLPQPPKKPLGRPPKAKLPLPSDGAPMSCFLEECCTLDPDAKTLTALVRARHRLWRRSNSKEDTKELCTFFDTHFQNVKETDVEHLMTSSYYKGVALKPERQRVLEHVQASFFRSMVPITKSATCAPGFFGLYSRTATAECREVGYNRSPNTRLSVLKLDSRGTIMAVIGSVQEFANSVMGKSNAYACNQLTKCFADGMRALIHTDGFSYIRAPDHLIKQTAIAGL
ncbi:MAG: hypothetical protein WDW38_006545 [Sanguina aurantia]